MQKVHFKKLSILGLILLVASIVAAAMVSSNAKRQIMYSISDETHDDPSTHSCAPTANLLAGDTVCADDSATAGGNSGSTSDWLTSDGATTIS